MAEEKLEKTKALDLSGAYPTADEIESGNWVKVDAGFEVHVSRANSPEFYRCSAAANRKFANKRTKEIPPEKGVESTVWVMARALFKGFRGPNGETVFEINGTEYRDDVQGRTGMLMIWPDFREEIAGFAGLSADEFQQEIEDAGKG